MEPFGFPNEDLLFKKYLYLPNDKVLLDLYHLTFKNVILDYEMLIDFHKNRNPEVNHSAYKFGQIINSAYLALNNFLVQFYSYLVNDKQDDFIITDDKSLSHVFGTYETGSRKGRDSWGNKNTFLLQRIGIILNANFSQEIKEIKYLEILCRNFFSHGWHLLFLNLFIMDTHRVNNYLLKYNQNYTDEDNIIFMKHDNFNKSDDMITLKKNLSSLLLNPFAQTSDLNFFLNKENYNKCYYLNDDDFIINTACSRIFLKKFFFNKYSFLEKQDKRNNIQNMYIKLSEIITNQEKIINIDSVFNLISLIVEKIDAKIKKLPHN